MSEDQLQPEDTLDDRVTGDVLDEGISPPDEPHRDLGDASLGERLRQEEPEVWADAEAERDADILDGPVGGEVGEDRDTHDASAEEAAVHTIEE